MNIIQWKTKGLAAILAVSLLGLPEVVTAQDHCDRRDQYSGAYQRRYYPEYDRGYGYDRDDAYGQPPADNPGYYSGDYQNGYGSETYRNDNYGGDDGYYRSRRSPGRSAAIVGGSAAAGAIFGALAGGGKGAAIGAAVGGLGGLIFDQASKDRHRH